MAHEMHNQANAEMNRRRMNDQVILIINGLNKRGRILAGKLSQQGANVVVASSGAESEWIPRIRQVVTKNGRSCLILIPALFSAEKEETFCHYAMQKIMERFRRLDAFITYTDTNDEETNPVNTISDDEKPALTFFDQYSLSQAAMKQILTQKNVNE
jgi:NAD(P)-dependent dehydrogenase (short-subunit alcohol dehydrogenase family)